MINDTYIAAGAKLKEIRKSKKLSSFKVTSVLNVPRKYIKQIERGEYAPSEPVLIILSKIYQVDSQFLLDLYSITRRDDVMRLMQNPQLKLLMAECTARKDLTAELYEGIIEEFKEIDTKYLNK